MRIFNSLGSNYDFATALATLLIDASKHHYEELGDYLKKRYGGKVYLTYKCREALLIGLKLLQLPKNSEIIVNGFTCVAVEQTVRNASLKPVYLDINKGLHFDSASLEKTLQTNKRIRAVIVQNTLGYPCEVLKMKKLCTRYKVYLIEDLAHSIGARYDEETEAGTVGDVTVLSFSQDKVVDAVSGGALIIRNKKLQDKPLEEVLKLENVYGTQSLKDRVYPLFTWLIRITYDAYLGKILHKALKTVGWLSSPMKYKAQGEFQKLPTWEAGLAMNGFIDLEEIVKHRRKIAKLYLENINQELLSPDVTKEIIAKSVCLRFYILVPEEKRTHFIDYLTNNGFSLSDIWYDAPVAPAKYAKNSQYKLGMCPKSEQIATKIVNLPTHRNVSEEQALRLTEIINAYFVTTAKVK